MNGRFLLAAGLSVALATRAASEVVPSFWLANEFESEHQSMGSIKVPNPVWNVDLGSRVDFGSFGYALAGLWTESDVCETPRDRRNWYFHELDPCVAYGYRWNFADGYALDQRLGLQWNWMAGHVGAARRSYDEWQPRTELVTPWASVWFAMRNFYWPVPKASLRLGVRRSFALTERLSFVSNGWFDGGSARWNRQRFGHRDPESIGSGFNSFSLQMLLSYRLDGGVSLYGGMMPYCVLSPSVRSELRDSQSKSAKTETVVAIVGVRFDL